jgi:hypothetical protein
VDTDDDRTWTARLRWPIAVGTGLLALLCCFGVLSDDVTLRWVGGIGLVLLVAWVVTFQVLFRRGF